MCSVLDPLYESMVLGIFHVRFFLGAFAGNSSWGFWVILVLLLCWIPLV